LVDQGKDAKTANREDGLSPHCWYPNAHDDSDDNYWLPVITVLEQCHHVPNPGLPKWTTLAITLAITLD